MADYILRGLSFEDAKGRIRNGLFVFVLLCPRCAQNRLHLFVDVDQCSQIFVRVAVVSFLLADAIGMTTLIVGLP
jgi:hypothetical protein